MRRWVGGGRCTCVSPVAVHGACPSCTFSAGMEEFVREHPQDEPEREVEEDRAERMHEAHLDRIGGSA